MGITGSEDSDTEKEAAEDKELKGRLRNYKETKARLKKAERQSYWNVVDHIIDEGEPWQEHHPKQKRFWSLIKSMRKDTSRIAPLKENGRLHAEPKDKTGVINRQYESIWTKEDRSSIPIPEGQPFPAMPEISVTKEGVFKLLLKLNPNKATGPDLLSARILKDLTKEIAPILTAIFQRSSTLELYQGTGGPQTSRQSLNKSTASTA